MNEGKADLPQQQQHHETDGNDVAECVHSLLFRQHFNITLCSLRFITFSLFLLIVSNYYLMSFELCFIHRRYW